jgi:hypothetical protein
VAKYKIGWWAENGCQMGIAVSLGEEAPHRPTTEDKARVADSISVWGINREVDWEHPEVADAYPSLDGLRRVVPEEKLREKALRKNVTFFPFL